MASLQVCPMQDLCPNYSNSTQIRDHFTRCYHACNDFVSMKCDMGKEAEMYIRVHSGDTVACSINKGKEYRK